MTLSSETARDSYTSSAAQTIFAYTFRINDDSHIAVYVEDVLQTLTTDYTVSGVGSDSGGNVTFLTGQTNGDNVTLIRSVPLTQLTDYTPYDAFPAETHEAALDYLTMIAQQLDEAIDRIVKLPASYGSGEIILPAIEADGFWKWNSAGDGVEWYSLATFNANVAAAATSASNAATSETNAATSETNAATSETNAATSETNAATSETNAATSETNAASSASAASTSASNASTSETNAASSASAASTSETNASTSETNAATSASNASTSETNAGTSETNAAASASAASTSETNAATSETNAGNSQTYAAEWANKAEDSLISVAAGGDNVDDYSAKHWAQKAAASASGGSNPAQVSAAEKTAGTETALRSYSPKDIADMAADHAASSNSDPDVRLLLHWDGSDGDTSIIDSTPYNQTVSVQGSSAIDTAQSKFGGSSGEVNSTNTGFVVSGSSNLAIGSSDDFCIECWYRPRAQSGDYPRVWQMGPAGWATGSFALFERQKNYSITKFDVVLNNYNSTNPFLTSTTTVSNGVWYHLAITRESGTVRLFVDGALEDSLANFTQAIGSITTPIGLGNAARATSYTHEFADGWIDDFRLIIGRAEYTTAFTPHTAAHPDPEVRTPENNYTATTDPGVNDDSLSGYDEGSQWSNNTTDAFFICADPAPGAAVWIEVGASTGMNAIVASLIFG